MYATTAVITGSTGGIGKEIARGLAVRGASAMAKPASRIAERTDPQAEKRFMGWTFSQPRNRNAVWNLCTSLRLQTLGGKA
ncbi:hypothetical protein SMD20_44075 [Nonomuraea sp. LP-02]|uniref:hypothetical protein n=1 Tax=Nonomuraea sp. LP-02 TaxID=3097960 RepID=UPI002E341974|nr:hypothetical protein [Nonomuraea sp. LP-02]MED7931263.1 hypothetical protein [Nonomuraea sp. LP-02]